MRGDKKMVLKHRRMPNGIKNTGGGRGAEWIYMG